MTSTRQHKKIAVILFNLGGPDSLNSVEKFLFNLFYDPAIIQLPNPLRWLIAKFISTVRNKKAQKIYSYIGNKSPLLVETGAQKSALAAKLNECIKNHDLAIDFEIFICMRYWHPMSMEVMAKIKEYDPEEVILLPLYPQFSIVTTGSSIKDFLSAWQKYAIMGSKIVPIKAVCCYHDNRDFIKSHSLLIKEAVTKLANNNFRILFSAHGLPVKVIKDGDPYQWQIENTVENIIQELGIQDLDYKVTYQSRVGPVEWLKPDTEDEIRIAGEEQINLILVPIAFVSEHVETLVELDIEYADIARKHQIDYIRVPTLRANEIFIESLSKIVLDLASSKGNEAEKINIKEENSKICPKNFTNCPCHQNILN